MCNIYLVPSDFLWFVCCHAWGPMPLALYEPFAMPCPPSNGIATGIATKLQKIVITELYIGCLKLTGQLYFPETHMCGPVWSWHLGFMSLTTCPRTWTPTFTSGLLGQTTSHVLAHCINLSTCWSHSASIISCAVKQIDSHEKATVE